MYVHTYSMMHRSIYMYVVPWHIDFILYMLNSNLLGTDPYMGWALHHIFAKYMLSSILSDADKYMFILVLYGFMYMHQHPYSNAFCFDILWPGCTCLIFCLVIFWYISMYHRSCSIHSCKSYLCASMLHTTWSLPACIYGYALLISLMPRYICLLLVHV